MSDVVLRVLLAFAVAGGLQALYAVAARSMPAFEIGLVRHLTSLAVGLWVAFVGTETAITDPLWFRILCTSTLVLGALALYDLVDYGILRRRGAGGRPVAPALVRAVGRALVMILSALVAASVVHKIPLPTVLVSSTVVSAVLGLALQDLLRNVFAGMAMQLESTLRVGDWLLLDDQPVRVVELSWRTVRLRTAELQELIEPNAELAGERLIYLGAGERPVAFTFRIGLPYETPPARARSALERAGLAAPGALAEPKPFVGIVSFDDSAITYELRVFTRQVAAVARFRDGVYSRIWYELDRDHLTVPFPTRTVYMHDAEREALASAEREVDERRGLLERLELFRGLDLETVARIAARADLRLYEAGEHLVREGAPGDSLFVVHEGEVVVSKLDDGVDLELARLGPGAFFGEMSLLTGELRSATVRTESGCEVLLLTREALQPVLDEDPSVATSLSQAITHRRDATRQALEAHHGPEPLSPRDEESIVGRILDFFHIGRDAPD